MDREYQIVTRKPSDPNFVEYAQRVDSFERAEEVIKAWYATGYDNELTFLIQERHIPQWHSVEAWTIGDYLDGETNWMK